MKRDRGFLSTASGKFSSKATSAVDPSPRKQKFKIDWKMKII